MKKVASGVALLLLTCSVAFAGSLEEANYTTPDSWSQHISPNGIVKQLRGINAGGGTFNLNLTSRYNLRANEYAQDQNFYQYLRSSYTGIKLGEGTFSANLFMRVAKDIDGGKGRQWAPNRYYFYNDILDVESNVMNWAPRFYQGNITFDNVIDGTKFTIGRQYVRNINDLQIDGGNLELSFLDDKLGVFVYGGLPVSYFVNTLQSYLIGGGASYKPIDSLKIKAEYTFSDILKDKSSVIKVRADWTYSHGLVYAKYGNSDGNNYYGVGTIFRNRPSKTTVFLDFEHLVDEFGDSNNYFSNPLSYALSPYGQYIKAKLRVQQGITDFLLAGAGVEYKNALGTENWDNRDYARYFANIDLIRLPFEGTYLTVLVDYWDVNSTANTKRNDEVTFGAELSQVLTEDADLWIGTSFNRYQYDVETGRYKDWVRSYYAGAQWRISKIFALSADFTYEDSQILKADSSILVNNFQFQFWLSISI